MRNFHISLFTIMYVAQISPFVRAQSGHNSRLTAMSGNSKIIMSLKITELQRMSSLFERPSSKRQFCCDWLSVKAAKANQCFSKPVFCRQQKSVHIQKSTNTLASAHYGKDTLVRLE
jgi:hypothetical protein